MFDNNFMSKILSLTDDIDSHRANMETNVDDFFCAHASKGINRCERTGDCMHAVDGCASKNVYRSEWEGMLEKEGTEKAKINF